MRLESSFRIALNWPEIGKMTMTSQFANMMPSSVFFDVLFLLSKFSYWSKFHVNIITGSGDMTIYFYKGLTRNPEIGNTPVWVLPNNSRLGRVTNTKISTHVSNEMLLNTAKCQGYSFYLLWVIFIWGKINREAKFPATSRLGLAFFMLGEKNFTFP